MEGVLFAVRYGLVLLALLDVAVIDIVFFGYEGCIGTLDDNGEFQPLPIIWTQADTVFVTAVMVANFLALVGEASLRVKTRDSVFTCSEYPSFSRMAY